MTLNTDPSTGNHTSFFLFWVVFLKHQFLNSLCTRMYSYWQLTQRTRLFATDKLDITHKKNRAKVRCLLRPSFQTIIYISYSVTMYLYLDWENPKSVMCFCRRTHKIFMAALLVCRRYWGKTEPRQCLLVVLSQILPSCTLHKLLLFWILPLSLT